MLSTASMIRNSAESVPIVMSVPQKSLSIEPTMPTTCRLAHCSALSAETFSVSANKMKPYDVDILNTYAKIRWVATSLSDVM